MLAALAAAATTYLAVLPGVTWTPPADGAFAAVVAPPCVADVWLTIGAGEKATVPGCTPPSVTPSGNGATVDGWPDLVRRNDTASLGALADALARAGDCVGADGPYAALAAADSTGRVAEYRAATPSCPVQFTEREVPARDARVVVVRVPERLHLGSVSVSSVHGESLLGTPKRPGLVTLPDVTRLLAPAGAEVGVGVVPEDGHPADPADLDRLANLRQRLNGYWVAGLISFPLLVLIALGLRRRVPPAVAVVVAAYGPAGFVVGLLPWWRWGAGGAWLAVLAVTLALAGLGALAGRALRSPELGLAAVVAAAFAVDLLSGPQPLQRNGLASYSMLSGGRFHGLGNLGFAVFATAVVVLAGAAARRYGRRAWLAFAPLAILDAVPGADFGGVVALAAAAAAAVTRRLRLVALAAVAGLGAALGVAYADAQRDDPTHLGRFLGDGDAGATVARKAGAALASVATAWPLLVAGAAVGAYLLVRPRRELHDTARVLAVLWVVGSLVNDTGIVVAGAGLALATPLLVSYLARRA